MRSAVVFAGLCTIDVAYLVETFPNEDSKTLARDDLALAGGPATNAAVACSALGTPATLVTALGSHALTTIPRSDLATYGVSIVDCAPNEPTRPPISSAVTAADKATRTVVSMDGTQVEATTTSAALEVLVSETALLIDGHHPEIARSMAHRAKEIGVPVVLDAGRWRPIHTELLPLVDVAICSAKFAPPEVDDVLTYVLDNGPQFAAITRGNAPIMWAEPAQCGRIQVDTVPAIDSLGAGDVLHGAFCHYYAAGLPCTDALREASAIAAMSCRWFGTREWIKHLSDRTTPGRPTRNIDSSAPATPGPPAPR